MNQSVRTLGDDVLAAFERACHEGDLEAAEHLLRTLELMASRGDSEEHVEHAYLELARPVFSKPRH
jgi:hypothetical protein